MNASTQAKVRPWDVYFGNDDIKEDDVAFVAAANMLRLYGMAILLSLPVKFH